VLSAECVVQLSGTILTDHRLLFLLEPQLQFSIDILVCRVGVLLQAITLYVQYRRDCNSALHVHQLHAGLHGVMWHHTPSVALLQIMFAAPMVKTTTALTRKKAHLVEYQLSVSITALGITVVLWPSNNATCSTSAVSSSAVTIASKCRMQQ